MRTGTLFMAGNAKMALADLPFLPFSPGGRLTASSTLALPIADIGSTNTLYYLPYAHNIIQLYNGTTWLAFTFSSLSISVAGMSGQLNADVFCFINGSNQPQLELDPWSSSTIGASRPAAQALQRQDGIWVKNGNPTRLYLGTIRSLSAGGVTQDSAAARFIWNLYNKEPRTVYAQASHGGADYAFSGTAWRQQNNGSGCRVLFVVGIGAGYISGTFNLTVKPTGATGAASVGVVLNSTTATPIGQGFIGEAIATFSASSNFAFTTDSGCHFAQAMEITNGVACTMRAFSAPTAMAGTFIC